MRAAAGQLCGYLQIFSTNVILRCVLLNRRLISYEYKVVIIDCGKKKRLILYVIQLAGLPWSLISILHY